MKVAIGCDHGGYVLKEACARAASEEGYEVVDYGCFSTESVDYPDYALKVALAIKNGEADLGVLLCGTGIGISIAANKVDGIRCAHVTDSFCAQMAREHNNANIIALGGRICSPEEAYFLTKVFLSSSFAGGRHQNRVDKITAIEKGEY